MPTDDPGQNSQQESIATSIPSEGLPAEDGPACVGSEASPTSASPSAGRGVVGQPWGSQSSEAAAGPSVQFTTTGLSHAEAERAPEQEATRETLIGKEKQRTSRSEYQDWARILSMFGTPPPIYLEHVSVTGDMLLGRHDTTGAMIAPPPQRESTAVYADEIQKIRHVYQRPSAYPTALRTLTERRQVVLVGERNVGKRAAAIRLAIEVRPDGAVRELSPDEDPGEQLRRAELKPGTVYLVDGLLKRVGQSINPLTVRSLEDLLATNDCYLIVCCLSDVPLPPNLLPITLKPPGAGTELMVRIHLDYYLDRYGTVDSARVEEYLSDAKVRGYLQERRAPSESDQMARLLFEALNCGRSPDQALRDFSAENEKEIRQGFDAVANNVEDCAFRVALAVFHGVQYAAVDQAGKDLTRMLRPEAAKEDGTTEAKSTAISPFQKTRRSRRLSDAGAELVDRVVAREYSENAVIQVVELKDQGYSKVLLKYLWQEFDDLREPLLIWLCDYTVDKPRELRARAAAALGYLATVDFDFVRARVFVPWAFTDNSDSAVRRQSYQALADALSI